MSRKTRLVDCEIREAPGKARTLTVVASTEQVGRDGDIIRAGGWQTENYERNPVVLWSHNASEPPIGRAVSVRKVTDGSNPRLEVDIEFAGMAEESPLGEQLFQLYRAGFLRSVSVGFIPRTRAEMTNEEKREIGMPDWGNAWTEAELLEISAVSVPADPGAVVVNSGVDLTDAIVAVRSASKLWSRDWDLLEQMANVEETDPADTLTAAVGVASGPLLSTEERGEFAGEVAVQVTSSLRDVLREFMPDSIPATPPANEREEDAGDVTLDDGWGDLAGAIRKAQEGHG